MTKRIVIDARIIASSTGTYIKNLVNNLPSTDDLKYTAILPRSDFDLIDNPDITKVTCDIGIFSASEQLELPKIIKSLAPDLVHFTLPPAPTLYRRPYVCTVHDLTRVNFPEGSPRDAVYSRLLKSTIKRASGVITPSSYVKTQVAAWANAAPDKFHVTPEAATAITAQAEPVDAAQDRKFLLHVGRIHDHKNIKVLVQALAQLDSSYSLVLAGGFELKRLDELLKDIDVDRGRIVTPGFVTMGQLRWLYENAFAYVLPSLSEGFGLPGLEAMANGCPLLSSSATCLPEVYEQAAIYFNPSSSDDLAQAINGLSPSRRSEIIALGLQQSIKYSWPKMAQQTTKVYRQTLPKTPSPKQ